MEDSQDTQEAYQALKDCWFLTENIIEDLEKVRAWSKFDFFAGSTIVSWMKRGRIRKINARLEELAQLLQYANKELEDIDLSLTQSLSDNIHEEIWDIWLDNPFTDYRIHNEIKDTIVNLENLLEILGEKLRYIEQNEL